MCIKLIHDVVLTILIIILIIIYNDLYRVVILGLKVTISNTVKYS